MTDPSQIVYISRRDPEDEVGETYVIIKVRCGSRGLVGAISEYDHLIRREILEGPDVEGVKIRLFSKYNIDNVPDRDIISQINSLLKSGNLLRDDLGNLVLGASFVEEYVGFYENSTGVLQTSEEVQGLSYANGIVTLNNHGLKNGDLVVSSAPLTNSLVSDVTPNTFKLNFDGATSGSNLTLRIPVGVVQGIFRYRVLSLLSYERSGKRLTVTAPGHGFQAGAKVENHDPSVTGFRFETGFVENPQANTFELEVTDEGQSSGENLSLRYILSSVNEYVIENGLVSKNEIAPATKGTYTIQGADTNLTALNGDYLLNVFSGTLRTGVYNISGNKVVNPSHVERFGNKVGGSLEFTKIVTLTSQSVSGKEVTFEDDHGIVGEQLLFTSLSPNERLQVTRITSKKVKIEYQLPLPSSVKIYITESRQIPQTIEKYKVGNRVMVKTLREIRNPAWDPSSKIILPAQLGEDVVDDPGISEAPVFATGANFNKFLLNNLNQSPLQEYQLADLQMEVFGSIQRAVDGLRLAIDTSKVAREGVYRDYHANGNLKMRSYYKSYRTLSILDGIYEEYFENGEVRVSYVIVPLHPYNLSVPLVVIGAKILIELDNHNVLVGDTIVLNDSVYVVEECPNANRMIVSPPSLKDGFGVLDFLRVGGYFRDGNLVRRAVSIENGTVVSSVVVDRESARAVFGNSVIHGSYIEFHKTLAFRVRCTFARGVLQGELVQWDEEGNREYVADFDRGNLRDREVLNYTFTY